MVFLRLVGLLLKDVGKDLLRHRGQHLLAVLTLASGLLLSGGGLLAVQGLDRWVSQMERLAKVTLFAAEGSNLVAVEGQLKRDPRFLAVRRISSQETTRRFLETTRDAGLMLKSLGEVLPETLELTLRPDLLAAHRALEVGDSLRSLPGVGDVVVDQERLAEGLHDLARDPGGILPAGDFGQHRQFEATGHAGRRVEDLERRRRQVGRHRQGFFCRPQVSASWAAMRAATMRLPGLSALSSRQ